MSRKNRLTTSDPLKYSEYERLLECLRKDHEYFWEMYARIAFCTACRVSDLLQFTWQDILGKHVIEVVEQKTKKARTIPLNPSVQQKFLELYNLLGCPDKQDYVLQSRVGDKALTIQCINKELKKMKRKYRLDIGNFSTHTFRKTFGRYVYDTHNRSAESLVLLNKIFKHTSISVTKTYIGITQEEISNIFDSIKF